ncbi:MAG TPA: enoyl-CoA hydratase-related protein [Methylomirabilota bacterium]|nr:enoyl-CoA hydratase-related protein [Methylomirabilota bacterium]
MRIVESAGVTIAAIDGACAGGAFERAIAADIRLAAEGATLCARDVGDGAACAIRLTRLLGEARAKEILLAGRAVDAAGALRLGLVTRVVPATALEEVTRTLAETLAALPPLGLRAVRDAVRAVGDLTPDAALRLEHEHFRRLVGTRDHKTAVAAFFERRTPAFTGE